MAKISARNGQEVGRLELPGVIYVYTSDGRILRKLSGTDGRYRLLTRGVSREQWEIYREKLANYYAKKR